MEFQVWGFKNSQTFSRMLRLQILVHYALQLTVRPLQHKMAKISYSVSQNAVVKPLFYALCNYINFIPIKQATSAQNGQDQLPRFTKCCGQVSLLCSLQLYFYMRHSNILKFLLQKLLKGKEAVNSRCHSEFYRPFIDEKIEKPLCCGRPQSSSDGVRAAPQMSLIISIFKHPFSFFVVRFSQKRRIKVHFDNILSGNSYF